MSRGGGNVQHSVGFNPLLTVLLWSADSVQVPWRYMSFDASSAITDKISPPSPVRDLQHNARLACGRVG